MAQLIKGKQIKAQTITINGSTGNVVVAGDLPMGANKITTTASSFSTNELVTKAYVDSVAQGLDPKESVITATIAGQNINLSSPGTTIGGYVLSVVGTRVLIKNQTDSKQNGIYNWNGAAVPMTRSHDSDGTPASEVTLGNFTFIEKGTNATTGWVLSSSDATGSIVTPGTNTQVWVQFSGAGSYSADGQGIELSAGQFSLELDGITLTKSSSGLKISDVLSSDITNTKNGLSTEVATRSTADVSLTNRISTEEVARSTADVGLTTRISAEEVTRSAAVSTEVATRSTADVSLTTRISAEEVARTSADGSLTTRISAEEVTRSAAVSSAMTSRISSDTSLTTRISTEEVTRSAAVSSAMTSRISADTSLTTRISAEEVTRSAAVSSEMTSRISADTSLTTRISAEEVARTSADVSLTNILGNVEKNVFESYTIAVSTNAQTVFTNAIAINNDPTYHRMVVDVDSVQVHLNGLVYSFSQLLAGGGVFYGDAEWASETGLPNIFNLYFNSAVAGFALETDDTIIISYRTYGIISGL